jgi:hypothetical protein
MPLKKNATPVKPLEGSSMLVAKSEDLSFRTSKLEELVKGFVKRGDLDDLNGELMNELTKELDKRMEGTVKTHDIFKLKESMEENMQKLVMLIQNAKEKIAKYIDMGQGSQENKDMVQVDKPSIMKPNIGGYVSNYESNQAWSSRGIQIPKIDMRKFDGKDPITWIFLVSTFLAILKAISKDVGSKRCTSC